MASRRKSRFDMPPNPAAIVRALRTLRDAMTDASRHLTIGGPVYDRGADEHRRSADAGDCLIVDLGQLDGRGGQLDKAVGFLGSFAPKLVVRPILSLLGADAHRSG